MASKQLCDVCDKPIPDLEQISIVYWFRAANRVCSPSCLVEFAWKLKEAQPKLSKSSIDHALAAEEADDNDWKTLTPEDMAFANTDIDRSNT